MTSDRLVTDGYLETIGVGLIRGRTIARDDRADSPKVAVINEELAERCWPGQDPIGRRVRRISQALSQDGITVVGLVADVREKTIRLSAVRSNAVFIEGVHGGSS